MPRASQPREWGVELRILWGDRILAEHFLHAGTDRVFRIGSAAGVDFAMSAHLFDLPSFDVVVARGEAFELRFTEKMTGVLWRHGEAQQLSEVSSEEARPGVSSVEIGWGDAAYVDFGPLRLEVASRKAPQRVFVPFEERVDFAFLSVALVVFFVAAGLVTTAMTSDLEGAFVDDLSPADQARAVKVLVSAPQKKLENALVQKAEQRKAERSAQQASKMPAGKTGAVDGAKQQARANSHRESAAEIASRIFGKGPGAFLGSVDKSLDQALADIKGPTGFSMLGNGGLGLKGDKNGGGGDGERQVIGGLNRGKGTRNDGGPDYGAGILCAKPPCKEAPAPEIEADPVNVIGSLDRELIRQVIHAHRSQIRFCYESELNRAPNLSGKVSIKFVINDKGMVSVAQVASSTMGNATVETCVASRVRTWVFPKPKGGGQVVVQYPFVFKASGQ